MESDIFQIWDDKVDYYCGKGDPYAKSKQKTGYKFKSPKDCSTFAEYDKLKQEKTKMANEKTLYEINRGDIKSYGYKLAVNSQGQWVMEIKGSGDVIAVDKATVSEVIPYTVGVKFASNGTIYHYFNEAKDLVKGDALVMEGYAGSNYQIAMVVDVDTKSKNATKEINYLKKI
jgi:hypothetical protein